MNRLLLAFVIGILLAGIPAQSLAVSGNVSGNNTNTSGSIDENTSISELTEENATVESLPSPVKLKSMKNMTRKVPKGPPV